MPRVFDGDLVLHHLTEHFDLEAEFIRPKAAGVAAAFGSRQRQSKRSHPNQIPPATVVRTGPPPFIILHIYIVLSR